MKHLNILLSALLLAGTAAQAVTPHTAYGTSLLEESRRCFHARDWTTASQLADAWILSAEQNPGSVPLEEAEYISLVSGAEQDLVSALEKLSSFMERHKLTIYANRVRTLMGSSNYLRGEWEEAAACFEEVDAASLENEDCIRMTLHYAITLAKLERYQEAYVQFSILELLSGDYRDEAAFYKSYMDWIENRTDQAEEGFGKIQQSERYGAAAQLYLAEIALSKGEPEKALEYVESLETNITEQLDPELEPECLRIKGVAYYSLSRYSEAKENLRLYAETREQPERQEIYSLGMSYYHLGDYSDAIDELLYSVSTPPDELTQWAYLYAGLAALNIKDMECARMAFEQAQALTFSPEAREKAMYNYALVLYETDFSLFNSSVTQFERFLNEYPASAYSDRVNSYLVQAYLSTSAYDSALASIGKIRNPSSTILAAKQQLLYRKSVEQFRAGDYSECVETLDKVMDLAEYGRQLSIEASFWRAECYYKLDQISKATADWRRFVKFYSGSFPLEEALSHYGLGYVEYNSSNYKAAVEEFDAMMKATTTALTKEMKADALLRRADSEVMLRNYSSAIESYKSAYDTQNSTGDYALFRMGMVYGLKRDYKSKVETLSKLESLFPASSYLAEAMFEEGRTYQLMEQSDNSIACFQKVTQRFPGTDLARKSLAEIALIHYQKEDYNSAIEAYKRVVRQAPGSDEAAVALRDLKAIYVEIGKVSEYAAYLESSSNAAPMEISERDSLTYSSAELFYTRADYKRAANEFKSYLSEFPQGAFAPQANYRLGELSQRENNYEEALSYYKSLTAFGYSPYCDMALRRGAEMAYSVGDWNSSLSLFKQLEERNASAQTQQLCIKGIVDCAIKLQDHNTLLEYVDRELALSPDADRTRELNWQKASAYMTLYGMERARPLLETLSADVRTPQGAQANFLISQLLFDEGRTEEAQEHIMQFVNSGSNQSYWLARSFILLSDLFAAVGKDVEARQYLLSLKQNYTQADDDILSLIDERLK